jgi:outer membrane protein assembly factor BamB
LIAAVAVLLAAAGAGVAYYVVHEPVADVHNGDSVPFTPSSPTDSTSQPVSSDPAPKYGTPWPFYGRTAARTRDASDMTNLSPPYAVRWKSLSYGLLEFPPSYADGILYEATDSGHILALRLTNGKVVWHRRFGKAPNQPAVWGGRVYFDTFDPHASVYALDATTGKVIWRKVLPAQAESSVLVWRGRVYLGSLDGSVWALSAGSGKVVWRIHASGAVKDSIAADDQGRLYFGTYGGAMYSVDAATGRVLWRTQTHGLSGGFRSGNFYASPAVAYGRVYISNTDGKVYSFAAATGQIAWTSTLPDWAYGSPAVAGGRVYATSYDGTVAAMTARTGNRLWTRRLPYRTLSSPVVIGRFVYVSDLGAKGQHGHAYAMKVDSGHISWRFNDGKYHTAIGANGSLVLAGTSQVYVLSPRR